MKSNLLLSIIFILVIIILVLTFMLIEPKNNNKSDNEHNNPFELMGISADKMNTIKNRIQQVSPRLLEDQCTKGNTLSCLSLGILYGYDEPFGETNRSGLKKDEQKSIELFLKECNSEEAFGCGLSSIMYLKVKNFKEALNVSEKGCDLNDPVSCGIAGFITGDENIGLVNYKRSFEFCSRGCDLNNITSCYALGLLYRDGNGIERDLHTSSDLFMKACEGNFGPSCVGLGEAYIFGSGVRQDLKKAKEYFGKACDLGDQEGCDGYRKLNQRESNH